jgi:hypothetical protein
MSRLTSRSASELGDILFSKTKQERHAIYRGASAYIQKNAHHLSAGDLDKAKDIYSDAFPGAQIPDLYDMGILGGATKPAYGTPYERPAKLPTKSTYTNPNNKLSTYPSLKPPSSKPPPAKPPAAKPPPKSSNPSKSPVKPPYGIPYERPPKFPDRSSHRTPLDLSAPTPPNSSKHAQTGSKNYPSGYRAVMSGLISMLTTIFILIVSRLIWNRIIIYREFKMLERKDAESGYDKAAKIRNMPLKRRMDEDFEKIRLARLNAKNELDAESLGESEEPSPEVWDEEDDISIRDPKNGTPRDFLMSVWFPFIGYFICANSHDMIRLSEDKDYAIRVTALYKTAALNAIRPMGDSDEISRIINLNFIRLYKYLSESQSGEPVNRDNLGSFDMSMNNIWALMGGRDQVNKPGDSDYIDTMANIILAELSRTKTMKYNMDTYYASTIHSDWISSCKPDKDPRNARLLTFLIESCAAVDTYMMDLLNSGQSFDARIIAGYMQVYHLSKAARLIYGQH